MYREIPHFDSVEASAFWVKVETGDRNTCWLWQLGKDKNGYGKYTIRRISLRAHRIAYFLHYGVDPAESLVCHSCDNPTCCNPYHLFLGDNQANILDSLHKGRQRRRSGDQHGLRLHPESVKRGEQKSDAKLTEVKVIEIRRLYRDERWTDQALADQFGVTRKAVSAIITGKTWKHLIPANEPKSLRDRARQFTKGEQQGNAKLTEIDVRIIRRLYASGDCTQEMLAKDFSVSTTAIRFVIQGRTWKHIE